MASDIHWVLVRGDSRETLQRMPLSWGNIPTHSYVWFVPLGSFRQQYGKRIYIYIVGVVQVVIYIYTVIYYSLPMLPCWQKRCSASWWITCCEKIPYMLWWGRAQAHDTNLDRPNGISMGILWDKIRHIQLLDENGRYTIYIPILFGDVQQSSNPLCDEWPDIPLFAHDTYKSNVDI